jgi:pyruvate dehydrogenase E1 component alpha subunit
MVEARQVSQGPAERGARSCLLRKPGRFIEGGCGRRRRARVASQPTTPTPPAAPLAHHPHDVPTYRTICINALAMALAMRRVSRVAPALRSRLLSGYSMPTETPDATVKIEFDVPYELHRLDESPASYTYTSKKELIDYFTLMYRMRRMEIAADTLYKGKFVKGFCHLYDGQEAICVGMEAAVNWNDSLVTSYRDHCQQLARGDTMRNVLSELLGKYNPIAKGKGGSMHMYKAEANFFGGNGIVGAQVPIGTGLAFAHKYKQDGGVAMALYGDGAANQGQLYEAMNMSALWKLPIIFVCENNQYGMGTSKGRSSANSDYYTRGHYIPGVKVDGMNALNVREATRFAKAWALENGPIVMEMDTYRYHGHSMSDPGITYRNRDEVAGVRKTRDPIERAKRYLQELELADAAELKTIEQGVREEVEDAVNFAKEAAEPSRDLLFQDIYVGQSEQFFIRACDNTVNHGVKGVTK